MACFALSSFASPQFFEVLTNPLWGAGPILLDKAEARWCYLDVNADLINAYNEVRNSPDKLLAALRTHQRDHDDDHYDPLCESSSDIGVQGGSLDLFEPDMLGMVFTE